MIMQTQAVVLTLDEYALYYYYYLATLVQPILATHPNYFFCHEAIMPQFDQMGNNQRLL